MEVFEAVRTVLAVRSYKETPVPSNVIRRIVESGRLTGSSMNGQPWHFIVVQNPETLRQLGRLARSGPYVAQAPLALVVAIERTTYAVSDASRAIQSMILTAWGEGVGSNWVGFMGLTEVKPLLRIPDDLDVLAILPFGYPADARPRQEETQITFRGRPPRGIRAALPKFLMGDSRTSGPSRKEAVKHVKPHGHSSCAGLVRPRRQSCRTGRSRSCRLWSDVPHP